MIKVSLREFQQKASSYLKEGNMPIYLTRFNRIIAIIIAKDEEDLSLRQSIKDIEKRLSHLEELASNY